MGFSRQEYWSGLPFSSPGNLPDPGIEPLLCLLRWQVISLPLAKFFTTWEAWKYYNLGEGNGNPLQYSCLENPMDGGAW